ncbi:MAG: FAD:protein FMN transferase [Longimicrobiales bacterium]
MSDSTPRPPDRRAFLALGVGALAVVATPGVLRRPAHLVRRRIPVMGTVAEVAVRHRDGPWAQRAIDAALAELRRVDATMSRFRPDSDVGRINGARGDGIVVSSDTAEVLAAALAWAEASGGRFDPCLGRVGGTEARPGRLPSPEGGWASALELDRAGTVPRVRLAHPDAAVDLGGIAKGYAVDLAVRALGEHGVFHALVNAGGDLAAMGTDASGEPWRIGVRAPDDRNGLAATLRVADRSVATSGRYAQGPHLLDPSTGRPVRTAWRSLTVEAGTCMDADAAATAAFCADPAVAPLLPGRGAPGARIVHSL